MGLEVLSRGSLAARKRPPLLFVHGAFAGAWCWDEFFLPWFAAQGYGAHAVSLRGHGKSPLSTPLDLASLDDYVADTLHAAAALDEPPVLIGHSMGAIVVQRAARRCNARAMILMAPVPPHGLAGSLVTLATFDPPLLMAINTMQLGSSDTNGLRRVRDYLFSQSITEADAKRHLVRMQRESQRALADLAWPQHLWIRDAVGLPTLVLAAERDAFFSRPMAEEAAQFHGLAPMIVPGMAHAMMLEPAWRDVAERMLAWVEAQRLDDA